MSGGELPNPVRAKNTAVILGLLRAERRLSRSELARRTGLSLPTVMDIVDRLTADGYLRGAGSGPATGGRRARLYEFDPAGRLAIGVSLGTHTITAALTDLDATVVHEHTEPSRLPEGPAAGVEQTSRLVEDLLRRAGNTPIRGVGVAVAALVLDSEDRALRTHERWPAVTMRELIAQRFGLPVEIDNYAKAVAVGEHRFGVGRGTGDMLCIVVQDGVGAALIQNGVLYRGTDGAAGRIGATLVRDQDGDPAALDDVAGARGITGSARARSAFAGAEGAEPTVEEIFAAARSGDPGIAELVTGVSRTLAEAVHNAAMLIDPELVVLTGSTVAAGADLLVPAVRELVGGAVSRGRRPEVARGTLGERAGAIGAAALLLQNTFVDPPLDRADGG